MHDCGHNSLFKSTKLNQFIGTCLLAAPVFSDIQTYSRKHTSHHIDEGSAKYPDLGNYVDYPLSKASLLRKVLRELGGLTALKFWFYRLRTRQLSQQCAMTNSTLFKTLNANLVLFLCCYTLNVTSIYLI
jgi:fatty acid desaturase